MNVPCAGTGLGGLATSKAHLRKLSADWKSFKPCWKKGLFWNPSYLFANNMLPITDLWQEVWNMRTLFLSKACAGQFRGFAMAQRQRYMGERGQGKHGHRPELPQGDLLRC